MVEEEFLDVPPDPLSMTATRREGEREVGRNLLVVGILVFSVGCGSSPKLAGDYKANLKDRAENCQYHEARRNFWNGVGTFGAAIGGASAGLAAATKAEGHNDTALILTIVAVATAGFGAGGSALTSVYQESYNARHCTEVFRDLYQEAKPPGVIVATPAAR